jgi:hypothetical protein
MIVGAILIGLIRFRKLNGKQRLLLCLLAASLLSELISRGLWSYKMNNFPVFHIYSIFEFFFLASIYRMAFNRVKFDKIINLFIGLFICFAILNTLVWQSIFTLNSNVLATSSLIFILCSLGYFYNLFREINTEHLERDSMFWINVAVLIYFSSSFVLFIFRNLLIFEAFEKTMSIWVVNLVFNFLYYLFFGVALWMKSKD